MPYVNRDKDGNIVGLFQKPQQDVIIELLETDNAEVVAYKEAKENRYAEGQLIREEMDRQIRKLAIEQLKQDSKLPQDYVDPTLSTR